MRQFGLIGYPLSHSFSKKYFTEKFQREHIFGAQYDLFPLQKVEDINHLVRAVDNIEGLNVTIPHKETIIPYLDELDSSAAEVGAVNVIKVVNGKLIGYNSDVYGFEMSLTSWFRRMYQAQIFTRPILNAYILGTGGASKAVDYVTSQRLFMTSHFVSRTPNAPRQISYDALNEIIHTSYEPTLIVNTTPLGTSPDIDSAPDLPYLFLKPNFYLYDLVYNPKMTTFMQNGVNQGCYVKNGLEMLQLQAERAWQIWNV